MTSALTARGLLAIGMATVACARLPTGADGSDGATDAADVQSSTVVPQEPARIRFPNYPWLDEPWGRQGVDFRLIPYEPDFPDGPTTVDCGPGCRRLLQDLADGGERQDLCVRDGILFTSLGGHIARVVLDDLSNPMRLEAIAPPPTRYRVTAWHVGCTPRDILLSLDQGRVDEGTAAIARWNDTTLHAEPLVAFTRSLSTSGSGTLTLGGFRALIGSDRLIAFDWTAAVPAARFGFAGTSESWIMNIGVLDPIASGPRTVFEGFARDPVVSGDRVVGVSGFDCTLWRSGPSGNDRTFPPGRLGGGIDDICRYPWIDGNRIAFVGVPPGPRGDHGSWHAFLGNADTGEYRQLTPDTDRYIYRAATFVTGDWVVWLDARNRPPPEVAPEAYGGAFCLRRFELWGYHIPSAREFRLVSGRSARLGRIFNGRLYYQAAECQPVTGRDVWSIYEQELPTP